MNKRPLSVTCLGFVFIIAGIVGIGYHIREFNLQTLFDNWEALGFVVRALAIVGGVFVLRGANWARWLLMVWMAYHVYISVHHSIGEVAIHSVLLVVMAFCLFHAKASAYFGTSKNAA